MKMGVLHGQLINEINRTTSTSVSRVARVIDV